MAQLAPGLTSSFAHPTRSELLASKAIAGLIAEAEPTRLYLRVPCGGHGKARHGGRRERPQDTASSQKPHQAKAAKGRGKRRQKNEEAAMQPETSEAAEAGQRRVRKHQPGPKDNAQKVRQLEHKITIQAKEDREQRQALREAHEMKVKVLELEHKASVKEMEEKHEAALAAVRSDALNNAQRDLQIITTQQKKLNEWQTCHESWVACAGKADAEMDKLRATVKEKDAELAKVRKEAAEEVEKANWARDKALAEKVAMRQKLEEMTEAMQKSVAESMPKAGATRSGPSLHHFHFHM